MENGRVSKEGGGRRCEGEWWREEEGGGFTGVSEGNGGRRTTSASCAGESARGSPDEEASAWRMVGGEDRGNDDDRLQRGQEREGLPGRGGLGVMDGGGRAEDSGNDGDRLRRERDRERLPRRGGLGVAEGRERRGRRRRRVRPLRRG